MEDKVEEPKVDEGPIDPEVVAETPANEQVDIPAESQAEEVADESTEDVSEEKKTELSEPVVEKDPALNCGNCEGDGLITGLTGELVRCPICGGTGKV